MIALLAMRVSELRPYVPPEVQPGLRRSVRVMASFVRRSRRVAVAFFTVLALSTFSFNFDVLLPLLAGETLDADADVVRPDRIRLRRAAHSAARSSSPHSARRAFASLLGGALGFGVLELALAPQDEPPGRSAPCSS